MAETVFLKPYKKIEDKDWTRLEQYITDIANFAGEHDMKWVQEKLTQGLGKKHIAGLKASTWRQLLNAAIGIGSKGKQHEIQYQMQEVYRAFRNVMPYKNIPNTKNGEMLKKQIKELVRFTASIGMQSLAENLEDKLRNNCIASLSGHTFWVLRNELKESTEKKEMDNISSALYSVEIMLPPKAFCEIVGFQPFKNLEKYGLYRRQITGKLNQFATILERNNFKKEAGKVRAYMKEDAIAGFPYYTWGIFMRSGGIFTGDQDFMIIYSVHSLFCGQRPVGTQGGLESVTPAPVTLTPESPGKGPTDSDDSTTKNSAIHA